MSRPGDPRNYLERLNKGVEHMATSADPLAKRLTDAWFEISPLADEHWGGEPYDKQEELKEIGESFDSGFSALDTEALEKLALRIYRLRETIWYDVLDEASQ